MLHLNRPPKPAAFDVDVAECRQDVEKCIDDGVKPDFPEKWKKYKADFARAQHGKCAYCECGIIGPGRGDVEHYFPKGEVWSLLDDPDTWGHEAPDLANISGRKHDTLSSTGYWWRAYDWENYLLACPVCNQAWKGSFFPVADQPRTLPPTDEIEEQPLLLNPFTGPDPAQHLAFNALGEIEAREDSDHGRETIKVCGLDRPSLTLRRLEKARRAHALVHRILEAQSEETVDTALADFYELGREEYDFAGMVRAIFEQQCLLSWEELASYVEELEDA